MLRDLGWNKKHEKAFAPFKKEGWIPARLIRDNKITYGALTGEFDEHEVIMSGKVYHDAESDAELPAVGDWVALDLTEDEVVIRARLPRQTCFSRKAPGKTNEEQVMAANVDTVVVVTDPGSDFNPRRMERYFTLISLSKAKPVVLVNKTDLFTAEESATVRDEIQALNPEADVHITSAVEENGLKALDAYFKKGVTITLIGSSGVGKSSIVNHILRDEYQWVDDINERTGKGRHTTTARELVVLPDGGILIDNPGIREVHMWTDEGTLRNRFADISEIARDCKFHDCKHGSDTGCAVRTALEVGELSPERFVGFLKLDDEIATLLAGRKKRLMNIERRSKRAIHAKSKKRLRDEDDDHPGLHRKR